MAFDQPLFAHAKYVQWSWPQLLGEGFFVVMFGGLHIEMALWSTTGDFLDSSGWTTALCEADIATSGVADSFLMVSHLTRTIGVVIKSQHWCLLNFNMMFGLGLGNISILSPLCNIRAFNINIANIFSHFNSIVCAIYRRILPHIAEHCCSF